MHICDIEAQTKFWGEKKKSTMHSDPMNPCGWDSSLNLVTKLELKKKKLEFYLN